MKGSQTGVSKIYFEKIFYGQLEQKKIIIQCAGTTRLAESGIILSEITEPCIIVKVSGLQVQNGAVKEDSKYGRLISIV